MYLNLTCFVLSGEAAASFSLLLFLGGDMAAPSPVSAKELSRFLKRSPRRLAEVFLACWVSAGGRDLKKGQISIYSRIILADTE